MSSINAVRQQGLNVRAKSLLSRVTYRRAVDEDDRDDIFRLRYDAYLREGAIDACAAERFHDPVDEQDNTFLYGVYVDDELAGSIRLSVTLPRHQTLPTTSVFPEFVGPKIAAGAVIVDPTRFVARHTVSRHLPELPYLTLRLAWLAMEHFDGDWILLAIRPEHRAFYRRYWSAVEVCEARPYPKLAKPVGLSVVDYRAVREQVLERHPFLASTASERVGLFEPATPPLPQAGLPPHVWQIEPRPVGAGLGL